MHVNAHTYYEVYFDRAKFRYETSSQQTRSQIDAKLLSEYKIQAQQIEDFRARNNQFFARVGSDKSPDQLSASNAIIRIILELVPYSPHKMQAAQPAQGRDGDRDRER